MANPNIVSVTSIKGESVGYNLTATTTTTLMTVSSDKLIKINRITMKFVILKGRFRQARGTSIGSYRT